MQIYENKLENKALLYEFLDFLKFKISDQRLTADEFAGISRLLRNGIRLYGTADDIAKFYHKSPQDVRNVVHRRMLGKPERRVYYSFDEFQKIAPNSWKNGKF